MSTVPPPSPVADLRRFPCKQCGASLEFSPGSDEIVCPFCTTRNEIGGSSEGVQELDYNEYLTKLADQRPIDIVSVVKCDGCGAEVTPPANVTSFPCSFCGVNIVAKSRECSVIRPNAVLPFRVTRDQATGAFKQWLAKLWWAPSSLRKQNMLDAPVAGMYLPAWTYDAQTTTQYRGQRGDAYYVTEYYTVNGRRQSRQVRKIRWSPASGTVRVPFDDVLILASESLPRKKVEALTPWDLKECVEYKEEYLAGFAAERYQTPLQEGFGLAMLRMEPVINSAIRSDIGGDEQQISATQTQYASVTFKHLLLPIWMSAYRYRGKIFRFLVNARTGEVQGERPYSALKITLAVIMAIIFIGVLVFIFARQ
jgi:predicted RNA-binding Zn-ribbon protein involved in translation (DUF1610 family)